MKIPGSPVQRALLRHLREMIDDDSSLRKMSGSEHRQSPGLIVENIESTDWASLTFVGEIHRIDLRLIDVGNAVTAIRARIDALLAAADIAVPGHIVAEIAVVAVKTCEGEGEGEGEGGVVVRIDALTLEE